MNGKFVAALMVGAVLVIGCGAPAAQSAPETATPTSGSTMRSGTEAESPGTQAASTTDPANGVIIHDAKQPAPTSPTNPK